LSWSKGIPLELDYIYVPSYPDGAVIDVQFECGKCGRTLDAEGLDIPSPFYGGDTTEDSRRWGDTSNVLCECGAEYDVVVDNSISGWDVNIEGEKLPKTFRYKEYKVIGEPEEGT